MKPSQLIARAEIDDAYDKLHAENEQLKRDLKESQSKNNFEAKRLKRLASICDLNIDDESDNFVLGVAGTIIGNICRVVEQSFEKRKKLEATLLEVSGCHSNHGTPKLCKGCMISIGNALDKEN